MSHLRTLVLSAASIAGLALSTITALATPAQSTAALNIRSGPGTSYGVVDTLTPGEHVNVNECATNGWCYIEHTGPDGWVSSSYLEPVSSSGSSSDPDCSFSFSIGSSGPNLSINCGDAAPPSPTPPSPTPPSGNVACFYTGSNYSGSEFCHGPATLNTLDGTFNDNIASVQLHGSAKARLCRNANMGGTCLNVTSDTPILPITLRNKASSLRVYTGMIPVPPVMPVTYSTGPINLPQTFQANLDNGNIGSSGADIWYRAVNPLQKFISPRNGAKLARGDGSNRGFAGCSAASFSSTPIPLWSLPIGTYVCAKTNQGRISQFRVNGFTGTTMKLGYTTWAN